MDKILNMFLLYYIIMPRKKLHPDNGQLNIYIPEKIITLGKKLKINFSSTAREAFKLQIYVRLDGLNSRSAKEKKRLKEMGLDIEKLLEDFDMWNEKVFDMTIYNLSH